MLHCCYTVGTLTTFAGTFDDEDEEDVVDDFDDEEAHTHIQTHTYTDTHTHTHTHTHTLTQTHVQEDEEDTVSGFYETPKRLNGHNLVVMVLKAGGRVALVRPNTGLTRYLLCNTTVTPGYHYYDTKYVSLLPSPCTQ
jgi:hypothetical protein